MVINFSGSKSFIGANRRIRMDMWRILFDNFRPTKQLSRNWGHKSKFPIVEAGRYLPTLLFGGCLKQRGKLQVP